MNPQYLKHRYFDLPQEALARLLRLPESVRIVRIEVANGHPVAGPPPLRVIIESDDFYPHSPGDQITSISPIYEDSPQMNFIKMWNGYRPWSGNFWTPEQIKENAE